MNHLPMFPQLLEHQFKVDSGHKPPVKRDLSFKQKAKRQERRVNLIKTSTENRQKHNWKPLEFDFLKKLFCHGCY